MVLIYHRNVRGFGGAVKPDGAHSGTSPLILSSVWKSRSQQSCRLKGLRHCAEYVMQCPISDFTRELNFQGNKTQSLSLINAKLTL